MNHERAPQNPAFWALLDQLITSSKIIIDRPKHSAHPHYPNCIYPLDYGYLQNTTSPDGGGIDLWRGSLPEAQCTALICTIDLIKRDSEIKLLLGCTEEEIATALAFHNESDCMQGIMVRRC